MARYILTAGTDNPPGAFSPRALTHLTEHETLAHALAWLAEVQEYPLTWWALAPIPSDDAAPYAAPHHAQEA